MIRVQEQDNNANGYLVWQVVSRLNWFFTWYLQMVSRSWFTSDILHMVLIKIAYDQIKNASLTYKSSRLSSEWPMLWHRGGAPPNGIKVKDPKWYLKSNIQVISFQHMWWCPSKNAIFKSQSSTPMQAFVSIEKNTFYGNWWQRGRSCTKI
jgi:hypothetical protein